MKRGIYLVSEPACLVKGSGAYRHIEIGMEMLGKHFSMEKHSTFPKKKEQVREAKSESSVSERAAWRRTMRGTAKDAMRLVSNVWKVFSFLKVVRSKRPDFIYERASFGEFSGLIVARLCGIPHVYECNGIQYLAAQNYYRSYLNPLVAFFERMAYRNSQHCFFVGTWGDLLRLKSTNWSNIENGVEQAFLKSFENHQKNTNGPLKLAFIGYLMPHHRPEILIDALKSLAGSTDLELHLIGKQFAHIEETLNGTLPVINHGFLERADLASLLCNLHVGLIPGGYEYPSQMKLFDYGAAKMLTIAPDTHNMKYWFSDDVLCFKAGDAESLASAIQKVENNRDFVGLYGDRLHETISKRFTWESVFRNQVKVVEDCMSLRPWGA